MHQAGHAVLLRSLDFEIRRRLARAGRLRPDAGVTRCERTIGQAGPVATNRCVEALGAGRVDCVIFLLADAIDPLDVWAEARLPAHVERHVHPEAARFRYRIDEAREWTLPRQRVVVALCVEFPGRELRTVALHCLRY